MLASARNQPFLKLGRQGFVVSPIVTAPVFHVQLGVFESLTGYSPDAVQKMIKCGEWREGVHFRRKRGRVLVDLRGYNEWVEGQQQEA